MCWKELCRWCGPKNDHGEEAISPDRSYRPKTRPPDSGDLPTTSERKPPGEGDASQSTAVAEAEASGSHEKSSTAEPRSSRETPGTQSTPPNKGDPYHQKPKARVDTINQPTRPNNARGASRTSSEEFPAKDQTEARNNHSAEKVEKVPEEENISS